MNISRSHLLAAGLILTALCLLGCQQASNPPKETPTAEASSSPSSEKSPVIDGMASEIAASEKEKAANAAAAKNFLSDETALKNAQAQLEELEKFKGKSIQVFQSPHFYQDGRIIIQLQDPSALENVDEYTYQNGEWQKPAPVRLTGDGAMEDNVTPLKDMSFSTIASIYGTWSEKAKTVEGAEEKEMTHAYVNINPVTAKRRWFCDNIEGTRAEYQIFFNLDGSIETYEKR